ncbi:EpsG family protein [Geminocystis herdmanii]|uniref:EpsG family protein n=1 Tax=Geminocystis herdmanii TaxID=669359 RepID=UPI000348B3FF|nr:EpsG family protein [Geminocystis herdmanii]
MKRQNGLIYYEKEVIMSDYNYYQTEKYNFFHKVFNSLNKVKYTIFFFGLGLWILSPILGIIPLLMFAQVNVSKRVMTKKQKQSFLNGNFFTIFLVLFTITIYASTYEVTSDLQVYLNIYNNLGNLPLFKYMESRNMEPITFIIPNLIKTLFDANENHFILVQALTINLAFILIAIRFMPSYYPTIMLLNITSSHYFMQLFLMRQFYAFIFLVIFIYTIRLWKKLVFSTLAILTHSSSLLFIVIGMIFIPLINNQETKKSPFKLIRKFRKIINNFFRKKIFIYLFFLIVLTVLPILFVALQNFSFLNQLLPVFSYKFLLYVNRGDDFTLGLNEGLWKRTIFDILILLPSIILIHPKDEKVSSFIWSVMFVFSLVSLISFYTFIPAFGRLTVFLSGLSGFFYTILLDSKQQIDRPNIFSFLIFVAIFTKILYFLYQTIFSSLQNTSLLWEGNPLGKNLVDYIQFLWSMIN